MGTGYLPDTTLTEVMNSIAGVPGDFAEVGVFRGALFKRLVAVAQVLNRTVHAFDSFEGMDTPGEKDGTSYPKGRLSSGGVDNFRNIVLESIQQHRNRAIQTGQAGVEIQQIRNDVFQLWDGYVPVCLEKCPVNDFAFIYIDLDHHDPTQVALDWAWPKLCEGGILGFDDYFPGNKMMASPPIDQFMKDHIGDVQLIHFSNNQLFVRKMTEEQIVQEKVA